MKAPYLVILMVALAVVSCKPRVITQIQIQRDTVKLTNHTRDSVYLRDSIYIKEYLKGDTVYVKEYRDRWRDRIKEVHDTSYISKTDSVKVAVPVEVEKKLSPVKKFKLWAFFPLILIGLIGWRRELLKLLKRFL